MSTLTRTLVDERGYHHKNLPVALLEAARAVLVEEGVAGLKLRAITRRVGVSHTAADPHFGDLTGLLSELAAIGFEELSAAMDAALREGDPATRARRIAKGYIGFASANPALFSLMFRSDRIDRSRPRLAAASRIAFASLNQAGGEARDQVALSLASAGRLAAAWSLVHGLANLIIDRDLLPLCRRIEGEVSIDQLVDAALQSIMFRDSHPS